MSGSQPSSDVNHDFFNNPAIDLIPTESTTSLQNNERETAENSNSNENIPRIKRTACVLCRKRKLKCDGAKPCSTCGRLGHECKYDEVRKKSGPKRGYVKSLEARLEARLAQVETMLKSGGGLTESNTQQSKHPQPPRQGVSRTQTESSRNPFAPNTINNPNNADAPPAGIAEDTMSWDMVSLGLEEPLPAPDVVKDMNDIYFRIVHPSMPILHRLRFQTAMDLGPQSRPPVSLRYAMWTHAAGSTDKYSSYQEYFYRRARKYLEIEEMRGHGEHILSLASIQAWILLCIYEFKNMYFPRAWLSGGRAIRLAQMMGIHRLDGAGLMIKQCCAPPRDWTEKEERRRTFWMAFWLDRCASMGTGWPMMIDEKDIMTNLPSTESEYQNGHQENTMSLREAMQGKSHGLSSFAGAVLLSAIFGRNLVHLHRPEADDAEDDLNGKFWERHRSIDGILLRVGLSLPDQLRIPHGLPDPNVVFLNMCLHTSVICLHQSAIFKADTHKLPTSVSNESKIRCITAATEIAGIMRSVSHLDISNMNPFVAFNLYVAARVFVQYLKSRKNDSQIQASLGFLLTAMHIMKKKNTLTESFLAQLEIDMDAAGMPEMNSQVAIDSLIAKGVPSEIRPQGRQEGGGLPSGVRQNWNSQYGRTANMNTWHDPLTGRREPSDSPGSMNQPIDVDMDIRVHSSSTPEFNLPIHSAPSGVAPPHTQQQQQSWHFGSRDTSYAFNSPEAMDLSPGQNGEVGGGTSSSGHSQRANSTSTAFTPPNTDATTDGNTSKHYSQKFRQAKNAMSEWTGMGPSELIYLDAPTQAQNSSSTPASTASFSPQTGLVDQQVASDLSKMSQEDFRQMADQLFPGILNDSGLGMPQDWNSQGGARSGMTPASIDNFDSETWNQLLEGWNRTSGTTPQGN